MELKCNNQSFLKILNKHSIILLCERVDKMLDGGIQNGAITEIYGEPGSGKTQLALQFAASISLKHEHTVCFLSTGESNAKRILEIMHDLKQVGIF